MTKLETLKEMLNEAIRESNKLSEEKDRLLWSYRGRNLSHKEFTKQRQLLTARQHALTSRIEELQFQLLLEELKHELAKNRYIIIHIRSLTHPITGAPQVLAECLKLPCQHDFNIIKYIEDMRRSDKLQAERFASDLLSVIRECQNNGTTIGYREIPFRCPQCRKTYAICVEIKPIPRGNGHE